MIGLGSSTLGIGLAIHLQDRFSAKAATVNAAMNRMHKNASMVMSANLRALRNVGAGMALVGFMGLRAMRGWVKQGAEFEYTMDAVSAVTSATVREQENLIRRALQLGGETKFTIHEVADAMKYLGMAGFDPTTINETIKAVTSLGAATDLPIAGIGGMADVMTNIMTAFQLAPKQSMRVADILTKIAISANTNVAQMGDSFKYSADVFSSLNIPLEESVAMMAMLGNAGLQASIAGTSLGNAWRQFTKSIGPFATGRQKKGLAALGLSGKEFISQRGDIINMVDAVEKLRAAYEKLPSVVARGAMEAIMGIRGARGIIPLIRDIKTGKTFKEYVDLAKFKSANEALRVAQDRLNNIKGDSLILVSAWTAFTFEFTRAMEPLIRVVLKGLIRVVKGLTAFARTNFGKAVMVGVVAFTALVTVGGAFLVILGTVGLLLQASMVSFGGMKMAAVWAYNAMTAAALRYAAASSVAGGVGWKGGAARYAKGTIRGGVKVGGRFVAGAAAGAAGAAVSGKGLMGLMKGLGRGFMDIIHYTFNLGKGFLKMVPGILKVAKAFSFIGWISMGLEMIGIKLIDQFKLLVFAIAWTIESTINAVKGAIEWIPGVDFGGTWRERQDELNEAYFGWTKDMGAAAAMSSKLSDEVLGKEHLYKVIGGKYIPSASEKREPTIINVFIDGEQAMSQAIEEGGQKNLFTTLGINP